MVDVDVVAVGADGHVAEGQRVGQMLRRRGELAGQDVGQATFFGLDDGAGVVRDQAAQQGFGVLDVAEVAGAVQAVQAGGRIQMARFRQPGAAAMAFMNTLAATEARFSARARSARRPCSARAMPRQAKTSAAASGMACAMPEPARGPDLVL